jgi:uncharacterized protein (TIGR03437 family)
LKGVSVSINGTAAPVQLVSNGQINCIVPFEIADPYAVVQVTYQGVASNKVTLYTNTSAPGVFALDQSGTGDAAALHPNGNIVNAGDPALVGETIAVYVTGLGTVTPASKDGIADTTLSFTVDTFDVYVDNVKAPVTFSGLAPGFAGLYQVNFVVPSIPSGAVNLDLFDESNGAYNSIATLEVSATTSLAMPEALHAGPQKRARGNGRIRSKADVAPDRRQQGFNGIPLQP